MKTILVATDFSKIARNAISYAVEIAKITKAKLVLFHVFQIPVVPAEVPIMLPIDEMENNTMDVLKKIKKNILEKNGDELSIECKCVSGFPVEEINLYAEENKVDLIVMGMAGAGYLSERFIGSTTTSLIRKSKCPVLAIDQHVKFKNIKKIALACDYDKMKSKSILEPLKEFARIFESDIYVLNVVRQLETIPSVSKSVEGIKLDHLLEGFNHSFHYAKNEDMVKGINDFVSEENIDMLVMIPRMHSVLKNIIQEPNTKQMAFHTKVPLLALHDKN